MAEIARESAYPTYLKAIRRDVCSICLDQGNDGSCGLTNRVCAIQQHWPAITRAVGGVESDRMDGYYGAVESQICRHCSEQDAEGRCGLRKVGDCAFYSYLPLVVDAVEEARKERRELPSPFF